MTNSYSISYNGQPVVKVIFKAHIGHLCPELHAMAKMANMYHIGRATTNILTLLVQGSANSVTLHFKKSEFQTSLRSRWKFSAQSDPPPEVVLSDRFDRSDRKLPFHFQKFLFPVPLELLTAHRSQNGGC